jgi:hypothetical protein
MWIARAHEAKRMCLGVKQTFTNGGECKRWNPMTLKCTPLWKLHSCRSLECLEPWLKRQTNTKLGPQDTIRKVLECGCLKCPLIVHLDLICMSYDQKKGQEFNFWPQIPLQQGPNDHQLGSVIHRWKDIFEGYKILFSHDSNRFDLRKIWASKVLGKQKSQFWDS